MRTREQQVPTSTHTQVSTALGQSSAPLDIDPEVKRAILEIIQYKLLKKIGRLSSSDHVEFIAAVNLLNQNPTSVPRALSQLLLLPAMFDVLMEQLADRKTPVHVSGGVKLMAIRLILSIIQKELQRRDGRSDTEIARAIKLLNAYPLSGIEGVVNVLPESKDLPSLKKELLKKLDAYANIRLPDITKILATLLNELRRRESQSNSEIERTVSLLAEHTIKEIFAVIRESLSKSDFDLLAKQLVDPSTTLSKHVSRIIEKKQEEEVELFQRGINFCRWIVLGDKAFEHEAKQAEPVVQDDVLLDDYPVGSVRIPVPNR